jgi:hypothetical protein
LLRFPEITIGKHMGSKSGKFSASGQAPVAGKSRGRAAYQTFPSLPCQPWAPPTAMAGEIMPRIALACRGAFLPLAGRLTPPFPVSRAGQAETPAGRFHSPPHVPPDKQCEAFHSF